LRRVLVHAAYAKIEFRFRGLPPRRQREAQSVNDLAKFLRRMWIAIGWFGIGLLIYLSLMRDPPGIDIAQGDKLEHIAAYATLMFWFAQLTDSGARRLAIALELVALGVGLEFAQRETGYRTFEYADMAADAIGVAVGWLLASPRLPNLLSLLQRFTKGSG
jgi:VanZ family protein